MLRFSDIPAIATVFIGCLNRPTEYIQRRAPDTLIRNSKLELLCDPFLNACALVPLAIRPVEDRRALVVWPCVAESRDLREMGAQVADVDLRRRVEQKFSPPIRCLKPSRSHSAQKARFDQVGARPPNTIVEATLATFQSVCPVDVSKPELLGELLYCTGE